MSFEKSLKIFDIRNKDSFPVIAIKKCMFKCDHSSCYPAFSYQPYVFIAYQFFLINILRPCKLSNLIFYLTFSFLDSFEKCAFFLQLAGIIANEDELSNNLPAGSRFLDLICHTFARLPYNFSDHNTVHNAACLVCYHLCMSKIACSTF